MFKLYRILLFILIVSMLSAPLALAGGPPRLIVIIADKDNLFKLPGMKFPVVTLKANEVIHLRIIANKSTEWDKSDNTIHTFTINAAQPGTYVVECTVKCGAGHDDMKMRLVVTP